MLQLLKNVSLILDDKDAFSYLENIQNETTQNQTVSTYLTLANFVLHDIAANYLCYFTTQKVMSNQECKIQFSLLNYQPCKIKKVKNFFGKPVSFDLQIDCLVVPSDNEQYTIEYAYFPYDIGISDSLLLPLGLDTNTLCYGVVSEYYALKMQFNEASIFELKYKNGLKNISRKHYDRFFLFRGL